MRHLKSLSAICYKCTILSIIKQRKRFILDCSLFMFVKLYHRNVKLQKSIKLVCKHLIFILNKLIKKMRYKTSFHTNSSMYKISEIKSEQNNVSKLAI